MIHVLWGRGFLGLQTTNLNHQPTNNRSDMCWLQFSHRFRCIWTKILSLTMLKIKSGICLQKSGFAVVPLSIWAYPGKLYAATWKNGPWKKETPLETIHFGSRQFSRVLGCIVYVHERHSECFPYLISESLVASLFPGTNIQEIFVHINLRNPQCWHRDIIGQHDWRQCLVAQMASDP